MTYREELADRISDDGVEFIYAMFVEMHGKPCAKLVPVTALNELLDVGAGFAGFAAGPMSQTHADPDILALPDPASYTQLTWQPNVAAMQCDATVGGEEWPYAPRVILKMALAAAAASSAAPPLASLPNRSSSASGFLMYSCMTRARGLAPNNVS